MRVNRKRNGGTRSMIKKLIRFALWLGIVDVVDDERETMQRLDELMLKMSSADSWAEYSQIRWDLANVNKPASLS